MIVTAPLDTAKSADEKLATPLAVVVASAAVIVTLPELVAVEIPCAEVPSISNVPPREIDIAELLSASKPIVESANMPLAIDPANCVFVIPLALTVTSPEPSTAKSLELYEATPVTAVVASLGVIVNVSLDMDVAINVPPVAPAVAPLIVNV